MVTSKRSEKRVADHFEHCSKVQYKGQREVLGLIAQMPSMASVIRIQWNVIKENQTIGERRMTDIKHVKDVVKI